MSAIGCPEYDHFQATLRRSEAKWAAALGKPKPPAPTLQAAALSFAISRPKPAPVVRTPYGALRKIIAEEAARAGVTVEQILGRSRAVKISRARQRCCYRLRKERELSWTRIGQVMGLNHTTVIWAVRKIDAEILKSLALAESQPKD